MKVRKVLLDLARVVADQAERDPAFAEQIAAALGLSQSIGTLEAGKACDLAIWDINDPAELVYRIGFNPLHMRIKDGR